MDESQVTEKKKRSLMRYALFVVVLILLSVGAHNLYFTGTISGNGFANSDVAFLEEHIRSQIEGNGQNKVEEIAMIIKSPEEMVGFVKVRTAEGRLIQQDCAANIGKGRRIIWKCSQ